MQLYKQVDGNRQQLPTHWTVDGNPTGNFRDMPESVHNAEGWFKVGVDPVPSETQKLGADTLTDNVWAKVLVDLTPQEIADKAQAVIDRAKAQLASDLQQATISSAILICEVFTLLYADGVLNVPALSDKAKDEFATLQALVDQYTP
jgi:hypothetical protein